ncbi:MAG: hypothetical protein M1451_09570 [Acidobacteria bacterium]|nr:hypothetical protein [Acidobacteriota bacterium]
MNPHAEAIRLLASADANARRNAAVELYRAARAAAAASMSVWLAKDAELADLFREQVLDMATLSLQTKRRRVVVGVAVRSENFQNIHEANGSPPFAEVPPDQDAMEFELHFKGAELDILTSR